MKPMKEIQSICNFSEADYPTNALSSGPVFYFFHQVISNMSVLIEGLMGKKMKLFHEMSLGNYE